MKNQFICALFILTAFVSTAVTAAAVDFPGRQEAKYKNLKTIEIEDLHKDFLEQKVVIIDVRSKLEFDTIHIKDAEHLALSDKGFADKLQDIVGRAQNKKIAFY